MSLDAEFSIPSSETKAELTLREQEWRELPDNPARMTFRGRYDHVDTAILDLTKMKEVGDGTKIRVLDFAGGVLPFGAPTSHDLSDQLSTSGVDPEIAVVDSYIPPDLQPSYPAITYASSLKDTEGNFQIVRALHVVEHMENKEYQHLRKELVGKIANGGLFISLQQVFYPRGQGADYYWKKTPNIIKIMQKRGRELIPVALLPDSAIPWTKPFFTDLTDPDGQRQNELKKYAAFRQEVKSGQREINRRLDEEGFETAVSRLSHLPPQVLRCEDEDSAINAVSENGWTKDHDVRGELEKNQHTTEIWFGKSFESSSARRIVKKWGRRSNEG